MKFRSVILAAASATLLATTATAAFAQDKVGMYGRLDSGWSFGRDLDNGEVGNSYILGGGVGYRFSPNIRADVTLGYRGGYELEAQDVDGSLTLAGKGDLKSLAGLINVYYDFTNSSRFTPYVGGGIGASRNKLEDVALTLNGVSVGTLNGDSKTSLAWQLSVGTAIRISQGISFDVGYRYMDMGKFQSADTGTVLGVPVSGVRSEDDLRAHEIQIGLRFDF